MARENLWIWEEDERNALRKALDEFNQAASPADRITLRKLAEAMGVSTMTVSNYLTGKRPLTIAIALAFEEISGIPVRSFSDRLADEIEAAPHASQDDDQ
ncbi:cI repressor protein [Pseudomonas putida TRO1]|uniref:Cro/Cl family transcriptional regulator n=3 Tax=Pseudomonas TaxID=286 RepID=A0AAP7FK83_9PSED|nr:MULTISPECIES: helix-turn-helix domain-containing protein [Pseudomonas]ELM3787702.1 helix-turn-helix domain-containing protein [Pseudomonas aeruginosa]ELM3811841.1 helix-turn-helix domain-containing protein [Pseudomonas aeruginosa]ELS0927287.1 helix-turn-helix domain-containing protein [Pseudomonas putida]ENY78049.1 cI repressor protein [Pseudomonas putida TRO1]OAH47909.1 Cro/Cl family transcriptional regulator [Pseudomonas monteilii]